MMTSCSTSSNTNTISLRLSPAAVAEIKARATAPGQGLRLSVAPGGCSGLSYAMEIAAQQPGDLVYTQDGANVYVDSQATNERGQNYYNGIALDYNNSLTKAGFVISNPNAQRSCGCGSSFEAN